MLSFARVTPVGPGTPRRGTATPQHDNRLTLPEYTHWIR
jgi:hypothetical protein